MIKDHEIREAINQLRDVAIEYHNTQQLRERLAQIVRPLVEKAYEAGVDRGREQEGNYWNP
jgi:hypothetical protein